jgi:TBC1 domain family protein 5
MRDLVLEADYSTALTLLLRYPSPQPHEPQTFVYDALYLEQNPTAERGSFIISKYSGRPPESKSRSQSGTRRKAFPWEDFKRRNESSSPAHSPAQNNPKSLESIFQDVSQGFQRRTESWGVAKAVRGAVTEARKNMQTMHYEPNLRAASSRHVTAASASEAQPTVPTIPAATVALESKIDSLEERNKALAITLREALNDLRSQLANVKDIDPGTNDSVKQALAKAESVHVCLQDPSVPVESTEQPPQVDGTANCQSGLQKTTEPTIGETKHDFETEGPSRTPTSTNTNTNGPTAESGTSKPVRVATANRMSTDKQAEGVRATASRSNVRPSLTDAGFSWMLDGGRNLSGFVSSTSPPPEQTRQQDQAQARRPSTLFGSGGDENSGTDVEHSELALHSLRGSRDPLSGDGPL